MTLPRRSRGRVKPWRIDVPRLLPEDARNLIRTALTGSGLANDKAGYLTEAIPDTELS